MAQINSCSHAYNANLDKQGNGRIARNSSWSSVDSEDLKPVLEQNVHSSHEWDGHGTKAENCLRSYGIIIDIDNSNASVNGIISIEDAKRRLDGFDYYIYSSQNHLKIKAGYECDGKVPRFHIFIPFDKPIEYELGRGDVDGKFARVFNHFSELFKCKIDSGCSDLARLIFPSCDNPNRFYDHIVGRKFDWQKDAMLGNVKASKVTRNKPDKTFLLDDKVYLAKRINGRVIQQPIREIMEKTKIFCPFCDDQASKSPSAFIGFNGKGIPFISCSHCTATDNLGSYQLNEFETNYLEAKAQGLVAFSAMKETGTFILYQDGILAKKEEKHIATHFINQGLYPPTHFDTFDIIRDYRTDDLFIEKEGLSVPQINIYRAPELLKTAKPDSSIGPDKFPIIHALTKHLFPVDKEREWFEQYLAEVFRRRRVRTAFLIIGVPGSGKNLFFENVVGLVVGKSNLVPVTNEILNKEFNQYLRDGVFYMFDEVAVDKADRIRIREKIKQLITNDSIPIEGKGTNSQSGYQLTGNCVFLSNNDLPMEIDDPDRRFNVIRTKDSKIILKPWYKPELRPDFEREVQYYLSYLLSKKLTIDVYNSTINNAEKRRLQGAVKTLEKRFYEALRNCDEGFFVDNQTSCRRYEDQERRQSFNIFGLEKKLKTWKKQGYISIEHSKELLYQLWGENPPAKISLNNPPLGYKRSTTTAGNQKIHIIRFPK
jgi:hypothetical protein